MLTREGVADIFPAVSWGTAVPFPNPDAYAQDARFQTRVESALRVKRGARCQPRAAKRRRANRWRAVAATAAIALLFGTTVVAQHLHDPTHDSHADTHDHALEQPYCGICAAALGEEYDAPRPVPDGSVRCLRHEHERTSDTPTPSHGAWFQPPARAPPLH